MKAKLIWVSAILILVVLGVVMSDNILSNTVNPQNILVDDVNVTNDLITFKGNLASSGDQVNGHEVVYQNETLYIKIKSSLVSFQKRSSKIDISLDNNYGEIKEVYLQGDTTANKLLIWPR